jgi:CHAT domain-containing protein
MRLLSMLLRLLRRLFKSFIILLSFFIGIPLTLLMLIFPSLSRKIESFSKSLESFNKSYYLRSIYQLSQEKIKNIVTPIQQDYLNFLMEAIHKVANNPNPELIYPFLTKSLDKLDEHLVQVLDIWSTNTLSSVNIQQAEYVASVIFNFSCLIQQFPLGNLDANLEIAITGYKIALNIFAFDTFPKNWANTQNNLAAAYFNRIKGNKADNLEMAIAAFTKALKVRTFDAFPQDWATTQNDLANAYRDRIRGDKADNLELAIAAYTKVLKVYTFDTFPQNWAMIQNNLAIAYHDRIRGDKADNLEMAIAACTEALKVCTFPHIWANTQNNLASVYLNRIRGDKADNLELALTACTESLKVYTFDTFPQNWAMTQHNLATAYLNRVRGDKADNLEMAIAACTEALKVRTFDAFPQDWAMTQNNLAAVYRDRIRGDKADNLELAIAACTEALKVYTFDSFPQNWAMTQNNLSIAYRDRIRGDKADNLELAIAACTEALKVRTFDAFLQDWAMTQNNLSIAYRDRIRGNKADNLELAIAACTEALKVYTFDSFPQNWAITQNNLSIAYRDRIRGDKAGNLEMAIASCTEALKVYTFDSFPQNWAMTQNNLSIAYFDRIRGNKADNLELAIAACTEALKVYTFDSFPQDWAMMQNNLSIACRDRIRGNKADNLEMAIAACTEALKVYTFDSFPQNWAMTQHNIATAYLSRIRGDRSENLEMAVAGFTEALKVYTFDSFPQDWAGILHNLATAYLSRIKGDRSENLEMVIATFTKVLKVYTFDDFPQWWAIMQNNLGIAYLNRVRGDKSDNLEQAIKSYHNALKIYTKENDPLSCLRTAHNLGILYYNEKQWQPVTEAYHLAIEALENARLEALNPQSRQETLSNAIDVFHDIVQAYINLNQPDRALEYIERSKARNLVELMTQKNVKPQGVNLTTIDQWNELRQRVVNEQIRIQNQSINQNLIRTTNLTPYFTDQSHLKEYQQELDDFIEQEITPIDPIFKLTQKVEPISFNDIKALTDPETCLLQWYITSEKILAFVVPADGNIQYWQSSETDLQILTDTLNDYLSLYRSEKGKQEWIKQLPNFLQIFADSIHINEILALIPDTCQRLIIIPHRYLHILPIHALPISKSILFNGSREGAELHDLFPNGVQYAPSCQLLQIAKTFDHSEFNKLFAIQNPTKDLLYTDLEVNTLTNFFPESQVIVKDHATKYIVTAHLQSSDYHCYHFSCHGGFNPNNPLESALFLANREPVNLSEIFELNLKKSHLVVLSACETGLTDLQSLSDEYIGLPSGFLFAGSRNVVSSLWTVSDLSTSFLMIKFYEILFDETRQISIAVALKEAQDWLQNLTIEALDIFLEQYKPQLEKTLNQLRKGQRLRIEESLKQIRQRQPYPFSNPYYWAAFIATGA